MSKHDDMVFLTSIISQICDYAVSHEMDPDDTLKSIATSILQFTELASCKGWGDDSE